MLMLFSFPITSRLRMLSRRRMASLRICIQTANFRGICFWRLLIVSLKVGVDIDIDTLLVFTILVLISG